MQVHSPLPVDDRLLALRIAASFLWVDLEIADAERTFLSDLARELDVDADVEALLAHPPGPDDIDPIGISKRSAALIRSVALRAIASDGHVRDEEMLMFDVLDDLLPR